MIPFVSTHILSKETTNLGVKFLEAAFTSLHQAAYPNEIVILDNGSFEPIFDLYSTWIPKFKEFDCEVKIIKSDANNFCDLRNQCLEHTNPNATYIHWQDTDEVYYPEDLDILKNNVIPNHPKFGMGWSTFYHFMIHPFQIQADNLKTKKIHELVKDDCRSSKDNMFWYHKGLKWVPTKRVHEKMGNVLNFPSLHTGMEYCHFGYIRPQWVTCLKWLHYDIIEHGHVGHYKTENVFVTEDGVEVPDGTPNSKMIQKEYLREWRTPTKDFLWDRRAVCLPFPNVTCREYLPEAAVTMLNGCTNEKEWSEYCGKLDSIEFLERWEQKYKECNNSWSATLDWVVQEMEKVKWAI